MAGEKGSVRVGSAGIVENSEGKILMALRGTYPANIWVLPGGGVDFGEKASEAFAREIKEETGVTIEDPEFVTMFELVKPDKGLHRVIFFHRAKTNDTELRANDDAAELKWMTVDEIKATANIGEVVIPVLKAAGYIQA